MSKIEKQVNERKSIIKLVLRIDNLLIKTTAKVYLSQGFPSLLDLSPNSGGKITSQNHGNLGPGLWRKQ